jgi:hypothetical protein
MLIVEAQKVLRGSSRPEINQILKKIHVDFRPASTTPKYHQLCEILRKRITDGTLRANDQLGLRIPDDLAVVGYFDTPWCHQIQPSLTSV